ncbi:MAG: Gldg family protein [Candidatus Hydrogenedentales bacterium]
MKAMRNFFGWFGLIALAVSLNLLVWTQEFFSVPVLAPLVTALVLGLGWLILLLLSLPGRSLLEDRSTGGIGILFSSTIFLGICIVLYLFLSSWQASWDLTSEGRRSLAPQTIQVLQAMNTEVTVYCFFQLIDDELVAIARDKTLRFLEQCQRYTPLLKVELLDPSLDRAHLEAMRVTHISVQGTIVLKSGDRQRVITLSGGSPRLEERDFTNSLINVLREKESMVYFMTGHQERSLMDEDPQQGGSMLGNLLHGESYIPLPLAIKISDPEIPMDADIIVINNPLMDFHPVEIEQLKLFMQRGGRLLVLIEPWRATTAGQGVADRIFAFFEETFGIVIGTDLLCTDASNTPLQMELTVNDAPFEKLDEEVGAYRGCFSLSHPVTRSFDQSLLLQSVRSVSLTESMPEQVAAVELLRSTPDYWAERDIEKLLQTRQAKWDEGERKGPVPIAVAAVLPVNPSDNPQGRSDGRILIVGDADFASNGSLIVPGHLNFLLNSFAWLSESKDLIAMRPTGREAQPLLLNALQERTIAWISILFTLQLVLVVGIVVYFFRRRHQ